jgi:small-conductance mechanosensitive channel
MSYDFPSMELFGIKFIGLNAENGRKLFITVALIVGVMIARWILHLIVRNTIRGSDRAHRARFWTHQGVSLLSALLLVIGVISIWFDDPARLTTAIGLISAGLAFALQKVITAFAGYFVILRGKNFTIGDRITMGGVRGDVIALGFIQTTIMEMGQPASIQQEAQPAMWVRSRQFTGRIVTVSNSQIFEEPIFNYTRDFPFIWEEIVVPITYQADRKRAEQILLQSTGRHACTSDKLGQRAARDLERRYHVAPIDLDPKVYFRLTDNWLELTVRFVYDSHGVRDAKDAISRDILAAFDEAGIGLASATYDIVGLPPIELRRAKS